MLKFTENLQLAFHFHSLLGAVFAERDGEHLFRIEACDLKPRALWAGGAVSIGRTDYNGG